MNLIVSIVGVGMSVRMSFKVNPYESRKINGKIIANIDKY